MTRSIIDKTLTTVATLNFADLVCGVVTPASQHVMAADGGTVLKIFPIYQNDPTTCRNGDYITCIPDDKYRSIIYFEEVGNQLISQDNYCISMQATVRLIGWFNLKKISNTLTSDYFLSQLIQTIPDKVADFDNLFNIYLTFDGIENKSPLLFSAYTYDEAEQQYLIFPYDYGAQRYTVNYHINKCQSTVSLSPNCGKRP
ncbi:MAG: hypothetical protein PHU98_06135 [Mariniphaga sp.]|nr:hypothetical protein [Paludibacter sp.]MDD4225949.1 hypothetical protein [Mariniphaga sp.]